MLQPLRLWVNCLAGLGLLLLPGLSQAQCPTTAACTPGKATSPLTTAFGMGIFNVTLGTINNTTGGAADGYKDYSCALGTTLTATVPTTITIKNAASSGSFTASPENVRVWIDYNNDGSFDDKTELAFSSDNKLVHTGTILPPATATLNAKLRLRVASDYANNVAPTPCSTPLYSQDEDYAVTLTANTSKPTAAFSQNLTTTCSGQVQFTDKSTGSPTNWAWDFGDNTSSTQQNPLHTYATAGTYQVKLTATNSAGSSTTAATAITYNTQVPVAANCAGQAAKQNCCNFGVTRVQLGTIDNSSADGSVGYEDFSCPQRTSLMLGMAYTLTIGTGGTNNYDTRAWLDLNNDGVFSTSEQVLEALNKANPSASLVIPGTATLNKPLRLRIVADGVGTNPQACTAPTLGQMEDYTVTVVPNTAPPVASFTSNYVAGTCTTGNTYTFSDTSTGGPTAWQWTVSPGTGVSFTNGTSAASMNPQIAFASTGYYTVSLKATNANGSSTSAGSTLLIQVPCLSYCASYGGYAGGYTSALWITNVSVSPGTSGGTAFSNSTANSTGGYSFYATQSVGLTPGATQTISVSASSTTYHRTTIWIDFNHDGVFANTTGTGGELVYNGSASQALATASVVVPAGIGTSRMRVEVATNTNSPNSCAAYLGDAEVEDYPINAKVLAAREALALAALTVSPNPTTDGLLQVQVSEASASGLYTLEVTNPLGTHLLGQTLRLGTAAPAALDLSALPAGLYLLRLTNAQGQTALRRVVRQ